MQGLENVDVPGVVILASGAITMGAMLLAALGWRRRNREAIDRLHEACELAERAVEHGSVDVDFSDCVDHESELSGTRELLYPEDDEITVPVLYTSADMDRCRNGASVRPIRRAAG